MRRCSASLRQDQWVEPPTGFRRVASSTLACNLGVITVGFLPGCRIRVRPATRSFSNLAFHSEIVGAVVSSRSESRCTLALAPALESSALETRRALAVIWRASSVAVRRALLRLTAVALHETASSYL